MNGENTHVRTKMVLWIVEFVLNYICYIPLTYVVLYCFSMAIVLVAGSSAEHLFVRILLFALGIKGGDAILNGQDIMRGFFYWWLIIGTVFQLFRWVFHLNFSKGILILLSLLAVVGTLALVFKTGSAFVPIIMFVLFVISLSFYYLLNWGFAKVRIFLEKA